MNQHDKLIFIRDLCERYLDLLKNQEMSNEELFDIFELAMEDIVNVVNGTFSYEKEED